MNDFLSITETPGALLNAEQMGRMALRYSLAAELAAGRRVLEVSCGAGVGLNLLAAAARTVTACDYAASVLPLAQQAAGVRVPLAAADAQALSDLRRAHQVVQVDLPAHRANVGGRHYGPRGCLRQVYRTS